MAARIEVRVEIQQALAAEAATRRANAELLRLERNAARIARTTRQTAREAELAARRVQTGFERAVARSRFAPLTAVGLGVGTGIGRVGVPGLATVRRPFSVVGRLAPSAVAFAAPTLGVLGQAQRGVRFFGGVGPGAVPIALSASLVYAAVRPLMEQIRREIDTAIQRFREERISLLQFIESTRNQFFQRLERDLRERIFGDETEQAKLREFLEADEAFRATFNEGL